jgi:phosphatidylglycerophosphatase A
MMADAPAPVSRPLGEPKVDPAAARIALAPMSAFGRFSLTAGGLGFRPFAPGTWGSLPPCVAVAVLVVVLPADLKWVIDAVLAVLLLWSGWACVRWGQQAEDLVGVKDPSFAVADEVAGMAITLLGLRWWMRDAGAEGWWWKDALAIAGAFLLFRAFDVLKPPPCKGIQSMRGGWGILMDDVIAGVYASVVMHLLMPR